VSPEIILTPSDSEYRQLIRDLETLRGAGAASNTAAIVNAVSPAAASVRGQNAIGKEITALAGAGRVEVLNRDRTGSLYMVVNALPRGRTPREATPTLVVLSPQLGQRGSSSDTEATAA
jgi:hypothetical protein